MEEFLLLKKLMNSSFFLCNCFLNLYFGEVRDQAETVNTLEKISRRQVTLRKPYIQFLGFACDVAYRISGHRKSQSCFTRSSLIIFGNMDRESIHKGDNIIPS